MADTRSLPIDTASLDELGGIFYTFKQARYATRDWIPKNSPEYIQAIPGENIVSSPPKDAHVSPKKIKDTVPDKFSHCGGLGRALNGYHSALRTIGKDMGLVFDIDRITPDLLKPEIENPEAWIAEFKAILKWVETEDQSDPAKKAPIPACYANRQEIEYFKEYGQPAFDTIDDIVKRFDAFKEVPIILHDERKLVPNEYIRVSQETAQNRNLPAAAYIWGIPESDNGITSRNSITHLVLKRIVGEGQAAGEAVVGLQEFLSKKLSGSHFDYNRSKIKNELLKEKDWIKTDAVRHKIKIASGDLISREQYPRYQHVLALVGEVPETVELSADKAAILLYTMVTDNLKKYIPAEVASGQEIAQQLADIGAQTAEKMRKAYVTNKVRGEDISVEQKADILKAERVQIKHMLVENPDYERTLGALQMVVDKLKYDDSISDMQNVLAFCQQRQPGQAMVWANKNYSGAGAGAHL